MSTLRLIKTKGTFISSVLATLIVQLVITFGVMEYARSKDLSLDIFYYIILFLFSIAMMFIMMFSQLPIYVKFLLFCFFSISMGAMLGSSAVRDKVSGETIQRAIIGTVGIFASMFILGLIITASGYDLSIFGGILFAALSVLIIFQIIGIFYPMSDTKYKIMLYSGLLLFSLYVIYDINVILYKNIFGKCKKKDNAIIIIKCKIKPFPATLLPLVSLKRFHANVRTRNELIVRKLLLINKMMQNL